MSGILRSVQNRISKTCSPTLVGVGITILTCCRVEALGLEELSWQQDSTLVRQRTVPKTVAETTTREMALKLADEELDRRKIRIGARQGHSHFDPMTWPEYEKKDTTMRSSAKERYSHQKALSGRTFWFVHYMYKKYGGWDFRHGDDICVFVDATNGEVLLVKTYK
jgi:hypothetical protein